MKITNDFPLLSDINTPADIRKLDKNQLQPLAKELREFLTHTVSQSGGHFSAGLVGPDGPTHAGSFDYSYLRCIPNMLVMAPADENECRQILYTGFQHDGPASVRYPRGKGPGIPVNKAMQKLPLGKAEIRHQGSRIALLAFGSMVARPWRPENSWPLQ